jgi:hypothetical protein
VKEIRNKKEHTWLHLCYIQRGKTIIFEIEMNIVVTLGGEVSNLKEQEESLEC